MNNEHQNPDESTVLNLKQFAPGTRPKPVPEPETGMTVMIKTAASQTVQQSGTPVAPKDGGALPPQDMLGAVSYCYAKGVYESEEIERKMRRDPTLREAVHGEVPDAKAIRRFRTLNRGAIQQTLEKAFGFMRRKQKAQALQQTLPGQPAPKTSLDAPGETTVHAVRRDAEERVQQAAFIDNMSKD